MYGEELIGKTLSKIVEGESSDDLKFYVEGDDGYYWMRHEQDCCENVTIESIDGDLRDLIGDPILEFDERVSSDRSPDYYEHTTWTFYTIRTVKASVTIRWLGSSNGYYSESVHFDYIPRHPINQWLLEF